MKNKPLGYKSYGHISHFPGSRMGPADHKCSDGQLKIATVKARDKHDRIIVQEKVDGSNVGIAKINGQIIPLTRVGYRAETSPFEQHHYFASWVLNPIQVDRFDNLLAEGERVVGEWLMQAHGTRYKLSHEPLVVFDLMIKQTRLPFIKFQERVMQYDFITPNTIHIGGPLTIKEAMERLKISGHGSLDKVEGAVWRVERNKLINKRIGGDRHWIVDFLAKYVRPDKQDGIYLPQVSGKPPVWNWKPNDKL